MATPQHCSSFAATGAAAREHAMRAVASSSSAAAAPAPLQHHDGAASTQNPTIQKSQRQQRNKRQKPCGQAASHYVDRSLAIYFRWLGTHVVGTWPKTTLVLTIVLAAMCGAGLVQLRTENRLEELWVPQNTMADVETQVYLQYFDTNVRLNQVIFHAATATATGRLMDDENTNNNANNTNVLTKDHLITAMELHHEIATRTVRVDDVEWTFADLCIPALGSCRDFFFASPVCSCFIDSILGQWNYDVGTLQNDTDWFAKVQAYRSGENVQGVLGHPVVNETNGQLLEAQAFAVNYLLVDRSFVQNGADVDPINSGWEQNVFLNVTESYAALQEQSPLQVDFFATRSFDDVLNGTIYGDLDLVQLSYIMVFLFLGAALGQRVRCGPGSRWTVSQAGVGLVALSVVACFGLSSLAGFFYGPVHSLLPFVLLGIGVDDAFVIVNAYERERTMPRSQETNEDIAMRSGRALARAGASITVTSATDLLAFAISATSGLPALASFCAYASIGIFFLWFFSSTFFAAALVLDERRQRDNRREIFFCYKRKKVYEEDDNEAFAEGSVSKVFRRYYAPALLSTPGKLLVLVIFAGLLGFGGYGATQLSVEDSYRSFIPSDNYLIGWLDAGDEYFATRGNEFSLIFTGEEEIFAARNELASFSERLSGLSDAAPYLTEPSSDVVFRNVMAGFRDFVQSTNATSFRNIELGIDGWPINSSDLALALSQFASFIGDGPAFSFDISMSTDGTKLDAIRMKAEYVRLVKNQRGRQIEDAEKLIEGMDSLRLLADSWDDVPFAAVYGGDDFLVIEGYKLIRRELFQNVGLAILAVAVIVFFTIGSWITTLLITLNVAFCIIEIIGFMFALGVVIDSISVINMVLAVGLTVDYSAHIGHCFMTKSGSSKDQRATEALADIGSAVLSGATSTFLAVFVLLFSQSYVFKVLAIMFALTVALGAIHGLVALPVMLSVFGPASFESNSDDDDDAVAAADTVLVVHSIGLDASQQNMELVRQQAAYFETAEEEIA